MQPIKKILVAPLNWGLGHATRCIPIIEALSEHGYKPVIASDGVALELLKKEFPSLQALELPSYKIKYAEKGWLFKLKIVWQTPQALKAIFNENKIINRWIEEHNISGIISDNRLGVYSNKVPCAFITHQLNVLSGNTSWITTMLHHLFIRKHDVCWIPDVEGTPNLSGKLGHLEKTSLNIKYIGPLSRLHKNALPKKYDLMVILSGPEPQRTLLEECLIKELETFKGKVIFIKGVIENLQKSTEKGNITFYNFMNTTELETAFNESEIIVCRSGYTTIMDLAQLNKKAFFIPTPGQYEQEYLAQKLKKSGLVPYARQHEFKLDDLLEIDLYKGLKTIRTETAWNDLFRLFESK